MEKVVDNTLKYKMQTKDFYHYDKDFWWCIHIYDVMASKLLY